MKFKHRAIAALTVMLTAQGAQLAPVRAAGDRFATPTGSGSACSQDAPCSLQTAIADAAAGDTVHLAGGVFTGSGSSIVTITVSMTVQGGWNAAPTGAVVHDLVANPTIIDGQDTRRAIAIQDFADPPLEVKIKDTKIQNGRVTFASGDIGYGAALYAPKACKLTLENMLFEANYADSGGAVAIAGSGLISNSRFISNTAVNGGGALLIVSRGSARIGNSQFERNTASYGSVMHTDRSTTTLSANIMIGNGTSSDALSINGGELTLHNSVIAKTAGAAITLRNNASGTLVHNTLADNQSAVAATYTATVVLTNNIIAFNSVNAVYAALGGDISGDTNLFWQNAQIYGSAITGTNVISANPRFISAPLGDYRLGSGSAAVDAAIASPLVTDVIGTARPIGPKPDLGAYEGATDELPGRRWFLPLTVRTGLTA
jgi:hypothetical protein